jgi:hypothetical protein
MEFSLWSGRGTFLRKYNLAENTIFYKTGKSTYNEAHQRLAYLKDVIENKGGHRIFYRDGVAMQRESDLQITES